MNNYQGIQLPAVQEEAGSFYDYEIKDEDGALVNPTSLVWSLTDVNANIINSRQEVALPTNPTGTIVLNADDTKRGVETAVSKDNGIRYLTIKGKYNSSLGNGINTSIQGYFQIIRRIAIPPSAP